MTLKLPPLKPLKCFVVCAKSRNFTKAATQLNLTQGAISKQIALLEDYLGLKLFERSNRDLKITDKAIIYLKKIEDALTKIEQASQEIISSKTAKKQKEILRINILPSISSAWLVPMLHDFERKFPYYDVVVKTGDGDIDFDKANCDLAIRVSKQKTKASWKKYEALKIMGEKLLCVCAPKFKNKIKNPSDLLQHNLLGHTYRPQMWKEYLTVLGIKKIRVNHSNSFEHFFMLIEAVKNGMGIGLVPEFLIKKDLKNKELVVAITDNFKSNYGYFLLYKKQKNTPQKIIDFAGWIKELT